MKQILLLTDFSDNALNAIFTALKLHAANSCHFILLHSYEPRTENIAAPQSSVRTGMIYEALHRESKQKLQESLKVINKVSNNIRHDFKLLSKEGDLTLAIDTLITEHDLDLIVMGTKGATGAKQVFMGSNAVRVIKKIRNCPILAVPRKFNFQFLKKIVFPTEYTHFFSKSELDPLLKLIAPWQTRVLVFHVAQEFHYSDLQKANKNILKERLFEIDLTFHKVTIASTVAKAITDFAEKKAADMICLIHYRHTFMQKLTQEPVVKKVGFHSKVPLLVLPE